MSQAVEPETEDVLLEAIVDKSTLTDWIETYRSIVAEARIHVDESGLYAIVIDPAEVAMMEQLLEADAFESYRGQEFTFGVDLETLQDYVEAGDADLVSLTFNAETRKLEIECGEVDLEMACIDTESIRADPDLPELDLPTDATLNSGAFTHAIDVVGMVSDHVAIDCDPEREPPIQATAEGDTDKATVGFKSSLQEGSKVDESCESLFSYDYMEDLGRVIPSGADLRLQSGDEFPVILEYEYADGSVECTIMVAPRIKTE